MVTHMLVNISSGDGLVPDGTKPLPEPNWPLSSEVQWHSPEITFTESAHATALHSEFKNFIFQITAIANQTWPMRSNGILRNLEY